MTAVMRRELKAYFSSPIGYVYLAVLYVFAGFYFFATSLLYKTTNISSVFSGLFMIVLFVLPILTMRLFSEDLKHRTDQALLTAPISLSSLVLGKFLAAAFVFFLGLSITLVDAVIVALFATPNWALVWGNYTALLLMGFALISMGMLISSMTENQVIAAVGTFAVVLLLMFIDSFASIATNPVLSAMLNGISFMKRYSGFTAGLFDFASIIFFISVSGIFIFLTIRVLEKRRWS